MGRKKKKNGKKEEKQLPNPSPAVSVYNGPLLIPKEKKEAMSMTTTLNFYGQISSTAGGVIDSFYSNDPNSYALAD